MSPKFSKTGQFYGVTTEIIQLEGITLTDTEYSQGRVPWHFHENNYFTFILEGGMTEGNKQHVYECCKGDLIFHNWQDAHYNIASGRHTRGFHIELGKGWFAEFGLAGTITEGSVMIPDPQVKTGIYNLFKEMKLNGGAGQLGIDALLLEIFGRLERMKTATERKTPKWVGQVREALHDSCEDWRLTDLARSLNIHPVHLSREFPKYFDTTLADYIRSIRVQKAMRLLGDKALSLTEIAFQCGFADQSHFIRSFKYYHHITPFLYRKLLLKSHQR
ncbi:MAG: helix-turn-helix transcriptional regulator [Bacteroidetes bacterium]|nr:helix-turn-helix transcriptional regulator [Bacteroidota bacterium]